MKIKNLYPFFYFVLASLYAMSVGAATDNTPTQQLNHLYNIHSAKSAGNLLLPTDVAVSNSRVYIVDSGNHRVAVYKTNGEFLFTFGKRGDAVGAFNAPVGVGVGKEGMVYVADTGNHRIQIFNVDGKFKAEIKLENKDLKIRPIDVAVDPQTGHIYITGNNNHQVMVYDQNGKLINAWGGNGADTGKFRYPATLVTTTDSRVAVVDVLNTRAQLFQQDGTYLTQIGEWGILPGQLFRPKGIALDRQGRVYISDSYMNLIQVFDDTGKFLHLLRTDKAEHGLVTPTGMAIHNKQIYVVEMLKHQVSVFQMD